VLLAALFESDETQATDVLLDHLNSWIKLCKEESEANGQ
jgi:hypothetical protein